MRFCVLLRRQCGYMRERNAGCPSPSCHDRPMFANLFSMLLLIAAVIPSDVQTARELRLKSVREAESGLSVRLTGVVTFCPPRGKYFYLQDCTGGVRVEWLADRELHPG